MNDRDIQRHARKILQSRVLPCLAVVLGVAYSAPAKAQSTIKQPGNHPTYSVDLEPHLALGLDDSDFYGSGGFGLGMRATIPFLRNGPIPNINNDMGIGFGLDWLSRGSSCNYYYWGPNYRYGYNNCSAYAFYLPIVLQWNFYLTDIITVYGEPGLGIRISHASWSYPGPYLGCPNGMVCEGSDTSTSPIPIIAGGAKFMFGRTIGLNVRLGYPYFTVGASFLL